MGRVTGHVALGCALPIGRRLLHVQWECNVRHPAIRERGAACQVGNIFHMVRAHDARVVDANVHEDFVQFDVLLRVRVNEVMILKTGNIKMIETIAHGLKNKLEEVVFVGGSVMELYVDDPAEVGLVILANG